MDWFKTGKGVRKGCILSPCLLNYYAGYIMQNARLDEPWGVIKIAGRNINSLRYANNTIMQNAGLDEAQPGIKIAKRNINNLRYADDTTLKAGSKE